MRESTSALGTEDLKAQFSPSKPHPRLLGGHILSLSLCSLPAALSAFSFLPFLCLFLIQASLCDVLGLCSILRAWTKNPWLTLCFIICWPGFWWGRIRFGATKNHRFLYLLFSAFTFLLFVCLLYHSFVHTSSN